MHTFNALIRAVPYLRDRFVERWELAKVRRIEEKRWEVGRVWALLLIRACLINKILQLLEDQKQELCPQILIFPVKEVQ